MKTPVSLLVASVIAIPMFVAAPPGVAHANACLGPAQARAAINGGQAVPLSDIARKVRSHVSGDIVGANLCRRGGGLAYVITVLQTNGAAVRVVADAKSGHILSR